MSVSVKGSDSVGEEDGKMRSGVGIWIRRRSVGTEY